MNNHEILFASKSPRREELMKDCGFPFRVEVKETLEIYDSSLSPELAIEQIALQKALSISKLYPEHIVLGCDTMVVIHGEPLGKPKDKTDASRMLHLLCGATHEVISGVALVYRGNKILFHEVTEVTFYDADEEFIQSYVNSPEPYDKAGAYGIQGAGKLLVRKINGDYYNVMGLPIAKIYRELKKL